MIRHVRAADDENSSCPVLAVGNTYPAGGEHPAHSHGRSQLLHAVTGTMIVSTDHGAWVVPPQQGLWIPGARDALFSHGRRRDHPQRLSRGAHRVGDFRRERRVLGISKLFQQLLMTAVDLPVEYEEGSRGDAVARLITHELRISPRQPLVVHVPDAQGVGEEMQQVPNSPLVGEAIDTWAAEVAMSRRSFTRLFRAETGLSLRPNGRGERWCWRAFTGSPPVKPLQRSPSIWATIAPPPSQACSSVSLACPRADTAVIRN